MDLAIIDPELLTIGLELPESFSRLRSRLVDQKDHRQFAVLNSPTPGEGASGNYSSHLVSRAENHRRPESELGLNGALDLLASSPKLTFSASEYGVAALHVGLHIAKLLRFAQRPEQIHLDLVVATDVYAPKHANHHRHDERKYSPGAHISSHPAA